jgi:hypothetical protein
MIVGADEDRQVVHHDLTRHREVVGDGFDVHPPECHACRGGPAAHHPDELDEGDEHVVDVSGVGLDDGRADREAATVDPHGRSMRPEFVDLVGRHRVARRRDGLGTCHVDSLPVPGSVRPRPTIRPSTRDHGRLRAPARIRPTARYRRTTKHRRHVFGLGEFTCRAGGSLVRSIRTENP